MSQLHILNKAPGHPRFNACLAAVQPGDSLLLVEDGVLACADARTRWPDQVQLMALAADLDARGIAPAAGISTTDYAQWVTLTMALASQSW